VPNDELALPESFHKLREYALRMRAERDAAVKLGFRAIRENTEFKTAIKRKDAEHADLKRLIFGARSEILRQPSLARVSSSARPSATWAEAPLKRNSSRSSSADCPGRAAGSGRLSRSSASSGYTILPMT